MFLIGDWIVCTDQSEIRFQITHREIIDRIKSNPQETELLVVCKETDQLYKERGVVAKGSMKEVKVISTPTRDVDNMVILFAEPSFVGSSPTRFTLSYVSLL